MTSPIWTDGPPPDCTYIPMFAPRGPGGRVDGVILSHKAVGTFIHFADNRTVPCVGVIDQTGKVNGDNCPNCIAGISRRWRGYISIQESKTGRIGILELTSFAVQNCKVLCGSAHSLRGKRIRLTRAGQRRNGHVTAVVEDYAGDANPDLPAGVDVYDALVRIWYGGQGMRSGE